MALLTNLQKRVASSRQERGAVLVLTALVMMLLLFIAAFATDLGAWYRQGQEQQRAADVSSLNGMQAYDRAVKEFFDANGVKTWAELSLSDQQLAESAGMREAVETVIGLLETSGLEFTDPGSGSIAGDPTNINDSSTWTVVATDGTIVTITRSFEEAGVDAAGNPRYGRAISVIVEAPGEQYFSNLLRDAPQIERNAQSVLSNCGAECTRTIEINPPFAGFNATGKGDGYGPLLYNKDGNSNNGYEEIWAVNHHVNNKNGDIICMDVETKAACKADGKQFTQNYQTGNRPVEYIDEENGLIIYSARNRDTAKTGLACFNAATRSYCDTPFVPLFDQTNDVSWSGYINLNGPWRWGNKFYAFTQDGQFGCAELSGTSTLTSCGTGNTIAQDWPLADLQDTNNYVTNGEQIGKELWVTHNAPAGLVVHCFDLSTENPCSGWSTSLQADRLKGGADDHLTFMGHNSTGTPIGVCVVDVIDIKHKCFRLDGTGKYDLAGFNAALAPLDNTSWGGDAITWYGTNTTRTFFAGGSGGRVGCWDWASGDCGYLQVNDAFTGAGKNSAPYGFAQVSDQCIIGLGHHSVFYSFNPIGFTACVDTNVNTEIFPCECADGGNKWGEVRMPNELLAKVDELWATVSYTENGPAISSDLDKIPLHLNDGYIDLSGVDESKNVLYLVLEVDAKLGADGKPVWQSPITADLAIIVQPTLTD